MSDHIQSVVPYGQCPVAASGGHCAFKTHAHLHAVVDHAYDFTMCNQGTFSVAESDVVGLKATHHLNPANKTPKELQLMLQKIPQRMLDKLEICAGKILWPKHLFSSVCPTITSRCTFFAECWVDGTRVLGLCTATKKKHTKKGGHKFTKALTINHALQQINTKHKALKQVLFIEDAVTEDELNSRLSKSAQAKANRTGTKGKIALQHPGTSLHMIQVQGFFTSWSVCKSSLSGLCMQGTQVSRDISTCNLRCHR